MPALTLNVLSLRYSSWSMRPWLALTHAGAAFRTETAELAEMQRPSQNDEGALQPVVTGLPERRRMGSVTGLFPVLWVGDRPVHEALAICEWVADAFPHAGLWPDDPLDRAQARSVCCEMASSFSHLRADLSCHLFARVPARTLRPETARDIDRVFEIWEVQLDRLGGPFLNGSRFGITDCMYYPVVSRFRSYGVALPPRLERYARTLEASPPVSALLERARQAPRIAVYDAYVRSLGGDPDAALAAAR